ncbi:winged helix-turn-helix transcriptional regulator [Kitasatospora sp. NPDC049285]|uniref:winged helix-turn-helix transcriptional regulator n=1 Tax=Kitasatospora sp. NPDC049285 TaxID=3157096 RepID=UPI00341A1134
MLAAIGLDEHAERVYTQLVAHGPATRAELAARCGPVPVGALELLQACGLVAPGAGRRFTAAPPAVALEALLTGQRHALQEAELTASMLTEAYRSATAREGDAYRDLVEVVAGPAAISHRVAQLQAGAERELLALVTSRQQVVPADQTGAESAAVERGVAYRVVLERRALDQPGAARPLFEAMDRQQQIRVVEQVPTKLIIADRALALVPLTESATDPVALVVRAPALVTLFTVLFEQTWEWAHPLGRTGPALAVGPVPAGEPDETDRRILALLLSGATDAAVAKQLNLGLRTVQRRISRLMSLARADTRIQLGWQAHRRGWVS